MTRKDLNMLDKRLRETAQQERTGANFSPLLHERLMGALRREGLAAETLQPETRHWIWRVAVPVGIAAAVSALVWLLQPAPEKPSQPMAIDLPTVKSPLPMPTPPSLSMPQDVNLAANDALNRGKYAYLDRDAQK